MVHEMPVQAAVHTVEDVLRLARQHEEAGEVVTAIEVYRQLLAQVPGCADGWNGFGALCMRHERAAQAAAMFESAVRLEPNRTDFLTNLGEAWRRLDRAEDAIAVLQRAVQIDASLASAQHRLGQLLAEAGRRREAIGPLRRALDQIPDERSWHALLADLLREEGNLQEASFHYRRVVELDPISPSAYHHYLAALQAALNEACPATFREDPPTELAACDHPQFSLIVCSDDEPAVAAAAASHAKALAGESWEVIHVPGSRGHAEAYRHGLEQARGEVVIFCRDEVRMVSGALGKTLRDHLGEVDVVGVMGTERVVGASWHEAGWPYLHGLAIRAQEAGRGWSVHIFGASRPLVPDLQGLDGSWIACRKEVATAVGFDAETFDGKHGYDLDFSFRAQRQGYRLGVSTAIQVALPSPPGGDADWRKAAERFVRKHGMALPESRPAVLHGCAAHLDSLDGAVQMGRAIAGLGVPNLTMAPLEGNDYGEWRQRYEAEAGNAARYHDRVHRLARRPLLSLVLSAASCTLDELTATLESIRAQYYPAWEVCIAADNTLRAELEQSAAREPRIRITPSPPDENVALAMAEGEMVALAQPGDLLAPHALYWIAATLLEVPGADLIYSDEDEVDAAGTHLKPRFKPDWNPDFLASCHYLGSLSFFRTSRAREAGAFRPELGGAAAYDFALRAVERAASNRIRHVARVLYHRRASAVEETTLPSALRALNEHLDRTGGGRAEAVPCGFRVRYPVPADPELRPRVSLIVTTRIGPDALSRCVASVLQQTTYRPFELLAVDDGSGGPEVSERFPARKQGPPLRVLRGLGSLPFAALVNAAAAQAAGDVLVLLEDADVVSPAWLDELVGHAIRPPIGAVGARLWYPNGRLHHAGMILLSGKTAHGHRLLGCRERGYMRRAHLTQNFSAVTGVCLAVEKRKFVEVGGMDEELTMAGADVDFCLRLVRAGYRNLWTPYSELICHEASSEHPALSADERVRFQIEQARLQERWRPWLRHDPAYNPNLSGRLEDFSLAWPPRHEDPDALSHPLALCAF